MTSFWRAFPDRVVEIGTRLDLAVEAELPPVIAKIRREPGLVLQRADGPGHLAHVGIARPARDGHGLLLRRKRRFVVLELASIPASLT